MPLFNKLSSLLKICCSAVLNALFPISCLNCRKPKTFLCSNCLKQILITNKIIYSTSTLPDLTNPELPGFCGIIAACDYNQSKILKKAIHLFKYKRIKKIGETLGKLMQKRIKLFLRQNNKPWIIIPLPLHKRKKLARGFNQNDILAKACFTNLEFNVTLYLHKQNPLKRAKYTGTQTKLTGFKRIANVQKAFAIIDVKTVADKNIIIVDDIATTGASLKEAAQTLLKAGAKQVWGFVLAKD